MAAQAHQYDSQEQDSGLRSPDVLVDGEHPSVVLRDICSRPMPNAHVVVFANEKGGVGKSTLAFHCCVSLCDAGYDVTVVDLDRQQQTLARALTNRDATARSLDVDLPRPRYLVLESQSGALLSQEIARVGSASDFVIIDVAGSDSAIARRAIALADTLVTPVNSSFVDIDLLGCFNPVTMQLKGEGHFTRLVNELRIERQARNLKPLDWVVMKNRVRSSERRQQSRIDQALDQLAETARFRLGIGLSERVAYRELFLFGLTHLDVKHIPGLAKMQVRTTEEITRLIVDLALPQCPKSAKDAGRASHGVTSRTATEAFRSSLYAMMQPAPRKLERVA